MGIAETCFHFNLTKRGFCRQEVCRVGLFVPWASHTRCRISRRRRNTANDNVLRPWSGASLVSALPRRMFGSLVETRITCSVHRQGEKAFPPCTVRRRLKMQVHNVRYTVTQNSTLSTSSFCRNFAKR